MMQRHRAHLRPSRPTRTAAGSPTSPATAIAYGTLREDLGQLPRRKLRLAISCRRTSSASSGLFQRRRRRTTRTRWKSPPSTTSAAIAKSAARWRRHYDVARRDPDIQIVDVDLAGDRSLELRHRVVDGVTLEEKDADRVLQHLADLWGYEVRLIESDDETVYAEHKAEPMRPFA